MELQVVILAGGRGQMLYPLAEKFPKALLPVANKPMIAYVLEMLDRLPETPKSTFIATPENHYSKLEKYLRSRHSPLGSNTPELIAVPEQYQCSIDTLAYLMHRLSSDVLVISGDLIMDSQGLNEFIDHYRMNDSDCSMLLHEGLAPQEEMQIFGVSNEQVVSIFNWIDNLEGFSLKKKLLENFPKIKLKNNMIPAYCYIFKNWLLKSILCSSDTRVEKLAKIKEDLIPFLLRHQMDSAFLESHFPNNQDEEADEILETPSQKTSLKITHYLCPSSLYCRRLNNIKNYLEVNQLCCTPLTGVGKKGKAIVPPPLCLQPSRNNPLNILEPFYRTGRATDVPSNLKMVSNDCVIQEGFEIDEKSNINKSVIGKNVKIGKKCKVVGCLVMDNVVLEDEAVVNNSVLCGKVVVGTKSKVLNSQVGHRSYVQPKSQLKDEAKV